MTGIERIAAERQRQIEQEGYEPEHDYQHDKNELVNAAVAYLYAQEGDRLLPISWPWGKYTFKPTTRVRNLEKAGALIAGEIDRLLAATPEEGA